MSARRKSKPLFDASAWDFKTLKRTHAAIEEVALGDLGLDIYPTQIEIISAEQMLDAYSSIGMPLMYRHWSFGKKFLRDEKAYRKGHSGLAYEIVINSNPCISYLMEENSMAMQTLVMAHAAFGHNHFFKNNYLFRQWTDADGILDYLEFAKGHVAKCEERHGIDAVEAILDAAHALMDHGVFRYRRPPMRTAEEEKKRERERHDYEERTFNDLWRTLPADDSEKSPSDSEVQKRKKGLHLPEENLLYFVETYSPILEPWQREILGIVRFIAQYFYPQKQTRVMNEGAACFVHYHVVNALFDKGLLSEGAVLEILHSHSNVIFQPDFDDPRFSGFNPYALGLAMMEDIRRIATDPTDEDRAWFPTLAGSGDWCAALKHAWANFRDESFIQQYLSPRLIRKFRLFGVADDAAESHVTVSAIHDEDGYRRVRDTLARSYDVGVVEPNIQVVDVDLRGDRHLCLQHTVRDGVPLDKSDGDAVLAHLRRLWGYDVTLEAVS